MTVIAEAGKTLAQVESSICRAVVCDAGSKELLGFNSGTAPLPLRQLPTANCQLTTDAALSTAAGMALTGTRCCAFADGGRLDEAQAQLRQLARQHLPLVIQAKTGGIPNGLPALNGCGLFHILPHDLQQAADFTILAHWLAEQALVPGLVAFDWNRIGTENGLGEAGSFLGSPEDEIEPPTPAQLLLFGRRRRRLPSWFDLDKPAALGSIQGADEAVGAAAGRRLFFGSHVGALAEKGMEELGKLTGRPLSFVTGCGLKRADLVLVVLGTAFESAAAAADALREQRGWSVGALGVTWPLPFPRQAVAQALSGAKQAVVLESADCPFDEDPPLFKQVQSCLEEASGFRLQASGPDSRSGFRTGRKRLISALCGESLNAGDVAEMIAEVRKGKGRDRFWLGIDSMPPKDGRFPKREVLLGAVANDYPAIRELGVRSSGPLDLGERDCCRLLCVAASRQTASEILKPLAEALLKQRGWSFAKGALRQRRPGVIHGRLDVASQDIRLAESGAALDLLLVDWRCMPLCRSNPFSDLKASAKAVIGCLPDALQPSEIWAMLPAAWRSQVRRLELELYRTSGGAAELLEAASALLADSEADQPQAVDWQGLPDPEADAEEVPALVRRLEDAGHGFESLARFWGEVAQPRQQGEPGSFPDPLATVGAVPACSAALAPPAASATLFPLLEAEKCTGCGDCWSCCPDSAIGAALLGIDELLDQAVEAASQQGKDIRSLRRIRKPAAQRAAALIQEAEGAVPVSDLLRKAFTEAASRMKLTPDESRESQEAFQAWLEAVRLAPIVTDAHFRQAEQSQPGSGGLLFLAFDPNSCQGCGMCISACPEDAMSPAEPSGSVRDQARSEWRFWESLPDTSGKRIAQAGQSLGLLPSLLLSRHCSHAQLGGGFGEPGSGLRLAGRLTAAVMEFEQQKKLNRQAERCDELSQALQQRLRSALTDGLAEEAPEILEAALQGISTASPSLSELDAQLAKLGQGVRLDRSRLTGLAHLEQEVMEEKWKLTQGLSGLGRARFGMVACGPRASQLAALFPDHRYGAPLVSELLPESADLACGLALGMAQGCLARTVLLRRAALSAEAPTDLPARLKELESLTWQDLNGEEEADSPPLLLMMDEQALSQSGLGSLSRLLASDLPVKILLLDERDEVLRPIEPFLAALACRHAFALSSSLAYPEHLAEGIQKALRHPGPAFIHLYAPSPQRHGFDPAQTLERARLAVESRLHPLVSYDPHAEGVFGLRISLDGNPAPCEDWGEVSLIEFAQAETRFAWAFESKDEVHPKLILAAQKQQELWKLYREAAGLENPFVARTRAQLEAEISAAQQQKFDSLRRQYETDFEQKMAAALRERLLSLAGVE